MLLNAPTALADPTQVTITSWHSDNMKAKIDEVGKEAKFYDETQPAAPRQWK
jgi:hypothetical protein